MTYRKAIGSPSSTVSSSEIERLLHHMPAVATFSSSEFGRGFAKSIVAQSRRRGWLPSSKQLPVMRELVTDLFTRDSNDGGDIQLIE